MPAITGNRPIAAPTTSNTQTAKPAAAQTQQAATGHSGVSSFEPAASSVPKPLSDANTQLAKFPAGADRDAVAKALSTPWPTDSEMKAASEALGRLAEKAPDGMTDADYQKIENGIMYKNNMNTMMSMVTGNMQNQLEEARKRGDKKD